MYKRYFHQNEFGSKYLFRVPKEEEFQKAFPYIFSTKESLDDIPSENELYFYNCKSHDITKSTTNAIERKDYNIHSINSIINRNKLLSLTKENQISYKDRETNKSYINAYNENYLFNINKSHEQSPFTREKEETTPKTDVNKGNSIIPSKAKIKIWIRGPYKKKNKIKKRIETNVKCFPFTSGNDLIKFDNKDFPDEGKDNNNIKKAYVKNLFKTKIFSIDSNKKLKKKRRKFKSDDIRKKIKTQFHKALKNIINQNLKDVGSQELFGFLPQTFIGNISKEFNKKYMNITYKELLSIDFTKNTETSKDSKIDEKQIIKNPNFLQYLENNPEISKMSGFDIIKNMKYRELLQLYFSSKEFENTIIQLKDKEESDEYINDYIYLSQNYINYFLDTE